MLYCSSYNYYYYYYFWYNEKQPCLMNVVQIALVTMCFTETTNPAAVLLCLTIFFLKKLVIITKDVCDVYITCCHFMCIL